MYKHGYDIKSNEEYTVTMFKQYLSTSTYL